MLSTVRLMLAWYPSGTMKKWRLFSTGLFSMILAASSIWFPLHSPLVHADNTSNILLNGDFSNGILGWRTGKVKTLFGIRGEYPIFEVLRQGPGPPQNCFPSNRLGNPFLSIEAPFGADGYIEQQITIPAFGPVQLSFLSWGWEGSNPTLGFSGLVSASVRIVSNNIEHTLETFTPKPMFTPTGSAYPT